MDKALNYLALAKKGRLVELGEEPVGAITRAIKGRLVIVADDASDHTWRRAKSYVAGTQQQCIRLPYTKDEMGFAIGRDSLAIAAITDCPMALALVKSLPQPEKYAEAITVLTEKTQKMKQRKKEAQAHKQNVRFGKKK